MRRIVALASFVAAAVAGCSSGDDRGAEPAATARAPSSSTATSSSAAVQSRCAARDDVTGTVALPSGRVYVFFRCDSLVVPLDLVRPVARDVPADADPIQYALDGTVGSPTEVEMRDGYRPLRWPAETGVGYTLANGILRIDVDPNTVELENLLAFGDWQRALTRTGEQFQAVREVELQYGGVSVCELDQVCAEPSG